MNTATYTPPTVAPALRPMPASTTDALLSRDGASPLSTGRTSALKLSAPVRSQAKPLIARVSLADEAGGLCFQHHNADGTETWTYEYPGTCYHLTSRGLSGERCECIDFGRSGGVLCKHTTLLGFTLLYDLLAKRGDIRPEALAAQTGSAEKRLCQKAGRQYWVRLRPSRAAHRDCAACGAAALSDYYNVFGADGRQVCSSISELSCTACEWRLVG